MPLWGSLPPPPALAVLIVTVQVFSDAPSVMVPAWYTTGLNTYVPSASAGNCSVQAAPLTVAVPSKVLPL